MSHAFPCSCGRRGQIYQPLSKSIDASFFVVGVVLTKPQFAHGCQRIGVVRQVRCWLRLQDY